ncbi:MAG: hypothetical protein QNJ40_09645 [Xanthomonadales bacterium]|nr:hypothetical protein [Xanthomonadales bacterium]
MDLTDCLDGPRPWDPAEVVRRCLQAPVPALFLVNSLDKPSIQAVQTLAPFNYLLDPLKTTELRVTVKLTLLFRTVEKARQQVSTDCQFIPIPGSTTALTAGPTAESTAGLAVVNSTGRTA